MLNTSVPGALSRSCFPNNWCWESGRHIYGVTAECRTLSYSRKEAVEETWLPPENGNRSGAKAV